ncbi:MAG: crossover junction endodeoxyribonuclease RuvC [Gemmatimonadetes bacterium]|nr:crossover junction endodeoxyribonuclease RuvC [Gemmatimonadota bacterium]
MSADPGFAEALVLGVDPGTAVTGYGVVVRQGHGSVRLVECGVIRTSAGEPLPRRIREIFEEIRALIERHRPTAVSVEDVFHGKNARTALTLGHARGAILLAAALSDCSIAEYTAVEIKKAVVGTGRATKDQVAFMVQKQLRLRDAPSPADAADGVAAALCHCMAGAFANGAPSPGGEVR